MMATFHNTLLEMDMEGGKSRKILQRVRQEMMTALMKTLTLDRDK